MKRNFAHLAIFFSLFIVACNSPYGKQIKINEHLEVYIKGEATEAEAKKLGNYIDSTWKSSNNRSLQLSKDSGGYTVRMVVDEDKIKKDSTLDASFMAIQFLFEEEVFKGSQVKLILTDNKFKDLKTIGGSLPGINQPDSTNTK